MSTKNPYTSIYSAFPLYGILYGLIMLLQSSPRQLPAILSRGTLNSKEMANETPPATYSPKAKGNDKVLSQRTFPGQGVVQEADKAAPEGDTSAAGHMGEQAPMEADDGGRAQFGPHMSTDPETHMAPKSDKQLPSRKGGMPVPPATSVQLEALDNVLEAMRGTSIVEEHRILMGTVIEKVQSVKSGLTEACGSLLTGFDVSSV